MNDISIFLAGAATTVLLSLFAVLILRLSLRGVLKEVCGNSERAIFWERLLDSSILLVPAIFVMNIVPDTSQSSPGFFEIVTQVKWGLIGLSMTIFSIGILIFISIRRFAPPGGEA